MTAREEKSSIVGHWIEEEEALHGGNQSLLIDAFNATKLSSPSFQFGTSIRQQLNESGDLSSTPGAGTYTIKTTLLGKVADSRIRTAPQFSLRSRINPRQSVENEPGPGRYAIRLAKDTPQFSFPKDQRHASPKNKSEPGPGAYSSPSAVGKQVLSTKQNRASMGFGTGERPPLLRVQCDLGPGEYGVGIAACQKQIDSRKKTSALVKFSKGSRSTSKTKSVIAQDEERSLPGPGTYRLPSGLCGGGASYPFRAAPKPTLSGREKFGSPFAS